MMHKKILSKKSALKLIALACLMGQGLQAVNLWEGKRDQDIKKPTNLSLTDAYDTLYGIVGSQKNHESDPLDKIAKYFKSWEKQLGTDENPVAGKENKRKLITLAYNTIVQSRNASGTSAVSRDTLDTKTGMTASQALKIFNMTSGKPTPTQKAAALLKAGKDQTKIKQVNDAYTLLTKKSGIQTTAIKPAAGAKPRTTGEDQAFNDKWVAWANAYHTALDEWSKQVKARFTEALAEASDPNITQAEAEELLEEMTLYRQQIKEFANSDNKALKGLTAKRKSMAMQVLQAAGVPTLETKMLDGSAKNLKQLTDLLNPVINGATPLKRSQSSPTLKQTPKK